METTCYKCSESLFFQEGYTPPGYVLCNLCDEEQKHDEYDERDG